MKKLLILCLVISGCGTLTAYQSEDGKAVQLKGWGGGKAKFENGAEIEKGMFKIPNIPVDLN